MDALAFADPAYENARLSGWKRAGMKFLCQSW